MKKITEIQKGFAQKAVDSAFSIYEKSSNYGELSGHYFGCIGMLHWDNHLRVDDSMDIVLFETKDSELRKVTSSFLSSVAEELNFENPILSKGNISGFLHESGSIFSFESPLGEKHNIAVAVVYGAYHQLKEKLKCTVEDDHFVDTLLTHIGRWQKKYAPDNDIIVLLAQTVLKPEVLIH